MLLVNNFSLAQITVNNITNDTKNIEDLSMMAFSGKNNLEILATKRGISKHDNKFLIKEDRAESEYSKDSMGVAFNHTNKSYVLLTGEISFKIKPGYSINSIKNMPAKNIIQFKSQDFFILKTFTPKELINSFHILNSESSVYDVEIYTFYRSIE